MRLEVWETSRFKHKIKMIICIEAFSDIFKDLFARGASETIDLRCVKHLGLYNKLKCSFAIALKLFPELKGFSWIIVLNICKCFLQKFVQGPLLTFRGFGICSIHAFILMR